MKNSLVLFVAFVVLVAGSTQAFACNYSNYCRYSCTNEAKAVSRAEKTIAKLEAKLSSLQDRRDRVQDQMDAALDAYDVKAEVLACRVTQAEEAGQTQLEAFLANPDNAECQETCGRYLSLYSAIDHRVCRARAAYDRYVAKRASVEARWQAKVDRMNDRIADVEADLVEARSKLSFAQQQFASCSSYSNDCGCDDDYYHDDDDDWWYVDVGFDFWY